MATNNAVSTEVIKSALVVEEVKVSNFQKAGTKTAVLKQTIETISKYPTKSVSSDKQDNIFSMQDFGFEEQKFTSVRTNVAFLDVPENSTIESVEVQLRKFPNACLYRIISNEPILTDKQKYSISAGLKTMDDYANSQVIRFGEGSPDAGELILDSNGKVQYRAVYFSATEKEDMDLRTHDEVNYMSKEIELEFNESILTRSM
ncbi:MAG TPA: hypothetical protein GXZ90_00690 [Clostridiales bacterium]|nr:hypothetical protein [Clostridiales bacterium]